MGHIMQVNFSRMAQSIPPNVFEQMDRTVAAARARGVDVIDCSKGNPDSFPEIEFRNIARAGVNEPANARYTPFDGKPAYLQAAASWYQHVHDVTVDPLREVFAVEGAVDGLADLFSILLNPGDTIGIVDPFYPSYHCLASMVGAREYRLPARASLGWLPDLEAVPPADWDAMSVLILNYPNNPTGAQAPREFFERAVEIAREHHIVLIHDFAYAGLSVDEPQISVLSVPGASECAIEIVSLSKMYGMAGWRAGFLAGNEEIVTMAKQFHYQMGSMITSFVQDAGIAALSSDQQCVQRLATRYATRRSIVTDGLHAYGYEPFASPGGIYVWMHAPQGKDGETFAHEVLDRAGVAVLPGSCFGEQGRTYVRMSLLQSEERLAQAVARIGASCGGAEQM